MDYRHSIQTSRLTYEQRTFELTYIIGLLRTHAINQVELLFGWPWGNEYGDWTPFPVTLDEIQAKIYDAEEKKVGTFEEDDLSIIVDKLEVKVLFCHEYDLHLYYNSENIIVAAILEHWTKSGYELISKTPS